jgi:hypothetical protein
MPGTITTYFNGRPVTRMAPVYEPQFYKTFQIAAPLSTHFVPATCAQVDCPHYLNGWRVRVEGLPPDLLHTAKHSGRKHTEMRIAEGETWLVFEAGQPCFKATEHKRRLDRPEYFLVRDGDFRGNPFGTKPFLHARPDFWVEDFAIHQDKIAERVNRG